MALLRLAIDADFVFDLHCDGESLLHLYASGWQREEAVALGAELGAEVVLLEENPGGGPFDEACAGLWWKLREALPERQDAIPLACFATTVELRGQVDVSDDYAAADAAALLRFLQRRGVIAGDPGAVPELRCEPTPLDGVDVLTVPAAGVLVYRKQLGDVVAKGELIAELVDPLGHPPGMARMPICSATHGRLFARMTERLARPGQKVCKVAGTESLRHRQAGKLLED